MTALITFFKYFGSYVASWFTGTGTVLRTLLWAVVKLAGIGLAVLAVATSLGQLALTLLFQMGGLTDIENTLYGLAAGIDAVTALVASLPIHSVLSKANAILPVTEVLSFIAIILSAKLIAMGVRLVVRFIPFLS